MSYFNSKPGLEQIRHCGMKTHYLHYIINCMDKDPERKDIEQHPLWDEYQKVQKDIRNLRPLAETGNPDANSKLDLLEERLSELAVEIGRDVGIPDPRRDDPLWQKWDDLWKKLREARRNGWQEDEETIWEEIKDTAVKLEARDYFSKN